jgi:hypothetical protein
MFRTLIVHVCFTADGHNLGYGVKGFELDMSVGSNVGDAVALLDAKVLEYGRPAITAPAKL